jgi:hypothetical protein
METPKVLFVGRVFIAVATSLSGCSNSQRQAHEPESVAVHTYQIGGHDSPELC